MTLNCTEEKEKIDKAVEENMAKVYPFEFSVIMPVYNVEQFLEEAVESIVKQTIGFENIQLILVDDGSTDRSGEICDEYKAKYPKQTTVIHKENGGQASARNLALASVEGKYVSMPDPDDVLEKDALEKAGAFLDRFKDVDICCIPLKFFGLQSGDHPLNHKFEKGTRFIDLSMDENADCIQMSCASAFFRARTAMALDFDEELYHAEDAKALLGILMDNPRLGLVSDTVYHYRKHGSSTIANVLTEKRAYLQYLQHFSKWALDTAEKKYGYIPKFVQYTVMYDLQWKLRVPKLSHGVLTQDEENEYCGELFSLLSRIDDDVILHQEYINLSYKTYALSQKYGRVPSISFTATSNAIGNIYIGDAVLHYGNTEITSVSQMICGWDFISFDHADKSVTMEGYHILFGIPEGYELKPYLIVDGKPMPCESVNRKNVDLCLGTIIAARIGFRAVLPLNMNVLEICPALLVGQYLVPKCDIRFGHFFPISEQYKNMRAYIGRRVVYADGCALRIAPCPLWHERACRECALLLEIWKKNLLGGRKAVAGRLFYHMVKPFKRRELWIVSDRITKADDSGEAFFRYLMKNKPKNTWVLFAISKKSTDAARMRKVGPCVDAMSFCHKLLHLLCDVNISAQADDSTQNPYSGHDAALRDLLVHQKFVFLQHGVIKDDLSDWLNRYKKNLDGFVTSTASEQKSIIEGDYDYAADKVWLVGLPRFDRLYHQEQKKITLMPTWRRYLMAYCDGETGIWKARDGFENSNFYKFYSDLLSSQRLLNTLDNYGYTLQFFPHPNVRMCNLQFQHDPRVKVLSSDYSYRDIYATSNLILTDYSSAVFDFAYLRKPIIYCQFDKDEFFAGDHVYTQGYFDYERDGFGEVEYDIESTIDRIIEYVKDDCRLKPEYRARIDSFFTFNDQNNSRRVLDKILQMPDRKS